MTELVRDSEDVGASINAMWLQHVAGRVLWGLQKEFQTIPLLAIAYEMI